MEDKVNLVVESYHLQGARTMLSKLMEHYRMLPKLKGNKEDEIYTKAELECVLSSKDNTRRFLYFGFDGMRFRNHKRDKKGKLLSVEAYYETD